PAQSRLDEQLARHEGGDRVTRQVEDRDGCGIVAWDRAERQRAAGPDARAPERELESAQIERTLDQVVLAHARARADHEHVDVLVECLIDPRLERVQAIGGHTEHHRHGARRPDGRGQHRSIRARDATPRQHLVERIQLDDLVTRRKNADNGPADYLYVCGSDHCEYTDLRCPEIASRLDRDISTANVLAAWADVAMRVVRMQDENALAVPPRVLKAHDTVRAVGYGCARHDADRRARLDAQRRERAGRHILDHLQHPRLVRTRTLDV